MIRVVFFCLLSISITFTPAVGQVDRAVESQLKNACQTETNPTKKYRNLLQLARYYQATHIRNADSMVVHLMEASQSLSDSIRLSALLFKASMEERRSDNQAYSATIQQCLSMEKKINDTLLLLELEKHKAWTAHLRYEDSLTLHHLHNYLHRAEKLALEHQIIEANLLLSRHHMVFKRKIPAIEHIDRALDRAQKMKSISLLAATYHFQAKMYQTFEYIDLGVEKGILALQTALKTTNQSLIIIVLVESGLAEVKLHNYREAEAFFQQALDRSLALNDDIGRAWTRLGLAQSYVGQNKTFDALFNVKRALAVYLRQNNIQGQADAYTTLGTVYRQRKEFDRAIEKYTRAIDLYEQVHDFSQLFDAYHHIGMTYYQQKSYTKALVYFNKSIEVATQYQLPDKLHKTYRSMGLVYQELHHYKTASYYQRKYIEYTDSVAIIHMMNRAIELNEQYKTQRRNQLIAQQADSIKQQQKEHELTIIQLENSQLKNNFQTYVIFGFCVVILMMGFILYGRFNHLKQEHQRREIEMNLAVLRTQMNPHFVFNTISVIQSFLYEKNFEKSTYILVKFARLIRLILENSTKKEISIETEEQILSQYLQTQQLRFDNKFEFTIFIPEELKHERAMIPPMITQPFIENAIEHGRLDDTSQGGMIQITFEKVARYHILNSPHAPTQLLEIIIEDNGVGITEGTRYNKQKAHKSMALDIVRERIKYLNQKYKTSGYFTIEDIDDQQPHKGTRVTLLLPYITEQTSF